MPFARISDYNKMATLPARQVELSQATWQKRKKVSEGTRGGLQPFDTTYD